MIQVSNRELLAPLFNKKFLVIDYKTKTRILSVLGKIGFDLSCTYETEEGFDEHSDNYIVLLNEADTGYFGDYYLMAFDGLYYSKEEWQDILEDAEEITAMEVIRVIYKSWEVINPETKKEENKNEILSISQLPEK